MDREWQVPEGYIGTATLVSRLQEDNARGIRFSLLVLTGAAAFLLLIACANTCALVLSRNATRQSEFSMRVALGSGAWRLFRQLLTESLLLYATAALTGFAAAAAVVRGFELWNPLGILPPGGIGLNYRACAGAAVTALLASIIFGTLPAFVGSKADVRHALQSIGRSQTLDLKGVHALTWITGAQIALALVFVTGAGLLFSTLVNLENQNYGFRTAQVKMLELSLPNRHYDQTSKAIDFEERLTERLRDDPGVVSAAVGPDVTAGDLFLNAFARSDRAGAAADLPHAGQLIVGPRFFESVKIPLLRGSDFPLHLNRNNEPRAVINELVARRYFPSENPIGKHIRFGIPTDPQTTHNPWYRVIGVVGDTRSIEYNQTVWKADPLVYLDFRQQREAAMGVTNWDSTRCNFVIAVRSPDALPLSQLQSLVWSLDPELPVEQFDPLDKKVAAHLAQPKMRAQVLTGFSGISLLLASIGLYGILSQAVAQRKREIAIRLAVGAGRKDVVRLIMRRALAITVLGVLGGTVLALLGARAVHSVLYGISALNPVLYAGAIFVLLSIAVIAALVPAKRAASVDPMINLRSE
jgi:putative ABC transport system permease protein